MEPILDQIKEIIGDNEKLKIALSGAGVLALLSLIMLNIPLFLLFVIASIMLFLQLQKKE
jgi:hypothetical protein